MAIVPTHGEPSAHSLIPCLRNMASGTGTPSFSPASSSMDMWYSEMRSGQSLPEASARYPLSMSVL